jgi:molybdopterin synthase sulfur carrier subunit
MPRVFIPPLMRPLTGGIEDVDVDARSVRQIIEQLDARFPGVKARLCQDDDLKPGLNVTVDGHVSSLGLLEKVTPQSEVHFLPAIGGG